MLWYTMRVVINVDLRDKREGANQMHTCTVQVNRRVAMENVLSGVKEAHDYSLGSSPDSVVISLYRTSREEAVADGKAVKAHLLNTAHNVTDARVKIEETRYHVIIEVTYSTTEFIG